MALITQFARTDLSVCLNVLNMFLSCHNFSWFNVYGSVHRDDGWRYHPKHVKQFSDKINRVTLHLVGYILEYYYCCYKVDHVHARKACRGNIAIVPLIISRRH